MKLVQVFITVFVMSAISQAQTWTWQHPSPQGNSLNDVTYANDNDIYIVGDYGTIIKSSNAGKTWTQLLSNTTAALYSVRVSPSDAKFVVACGDSNTYVISTDAGNTWNRNTVRANGGAVTFPGVAWRCVTFRGASALITMCGDNADIVLSTDNGVSWLIKNGKDAPTPIPTLPGYPGYGPLRSIIYETNSLRGVAAGDSVLLNTADAGQTWNFVLQANRPGLNLAGTSLRAVTAPSIVQSPNFFVGGYNSNGTGLIWRSTNDGADWINTTNTSANQYTDLHLVPGSLGKIYATTMDGSLINSTNAGASWFTENSFTSLNVSTPLAAIAASSGNSACIITKTGRIFTETYTTPWAERDSGSTNTLHDISMVDDLNGVACGDNSAIAITKNGGVKWTEVTVGNAGNFQCVSMSSTKLGYAGDDKGQVFHTQDGGVSWTSQGTVSLGTINGIKSIDDNVVWATSSRGELLLTSNAGGTWLPNRVLTQGQGLGAIFFLSKDYGWVAAQNDSIFATTDAGNSWTGTRITPGAISTHFNDVAFSDLLNGWVACNGTFYRTTNAGVSWTNKGIFSPALLPTTILSTVGVTDGSNAWCTGSGGLIYFTSDGGVTWNSQLSSTNVSLLGLHMTDNANGWTCGVNGAILKYSNTNSATLVFPKVIDFGKVAYGLCKDDTILVENPSNVSVTINSANVNEIIPAGSVQFSMVTLLPMTIPANGSASMIIEFCPVKSGTNQNRSAIMSVSGFGGGTSTTPSITLLGFGAVSSISVNPCDYNFGDVYKGHCKTYGFVVKNTGQIPITVNIEFLLGTSNPHVLSVFKDLTPDKVIAVNDTGTILVQYCPDDTTYDILNYHFTGVPNTATCKLSGHGVWLSVNVTPTSCIDLGKIKGSQTRDITIENTGNLDDCISFIVEPQDTQFTMTNVRNFLFKNCATIKRGKAETKTSTFTLNPFGLGKACDTTYIVIVNKFGERLDSVCWNWCYDHQNMCDANDSFPCIPVNTQDKERVVIHNCGDTITVSKITIGGLDSPAFSWAPIIPPNLDQLLPSPGWQLGPHDSIVVWFIFHPGPNDVGPKQDAELAVWYPDSDGVAYPKGACGLLQGLNQIGPASPTCVNFGSVQQSAVPLADNSCGFINVGTADITLTPTATGSTNAFSIVPAGDILVKADSTVMLQLKFNPPVPGTYHEDLTLTANPTGKVFHICMDGTTFTSDLGWSPADTCFGAMLIGTTQCDTGTIVNSGTTPIAINSMAVTGETTEFSTPVVLEGAPPLTIQPGGSIHVVFCFAPATAGKHTITTTFASDLAGVSPKFTRCGTGYATGLTTVRISTVPTTVAVGDLGNASVHAYVDLGTAVDNTPATSFRGKLKYDPTRLKYDGASYSTLTSNWSGSPTIVTGPNSIAFQACDASHPLKGTGHLLDFVFTPYYGTAQSTTIYFDSLSPFMFNVVCGGDSTNPIASEIQFDTLNYDSICGISFSSISFQPGTYLFQTAPNPATQSLIVPFQTKDEGHVLLRIVNAFGLEVARLVDADLPKGYREVPYSSSSLPEGMYFYELQTPDTRLVRRLLIVK